MNNEIALYSFLFLAILFILPGIREIIQRKAKIMGNYRTPRIVTGKFAVYAGTGKVIYGISFIFIYISSKFYKYSGLISYLVPFLLIFSGGLIHFYLGRRDPNIIEEEKTDREIIKQKDNDPKVRRNRTRSLLLAALIVIVLGTGMTALLFPLIDEDIGSTSEMISIFLFCSFGLSVMAFLSILRNFLQKKTNGEVVMITLLASLWG